LTVTRKEDGGIVWNCYRASCEERGGHGGNGSYHRDGDRKAAPKPVRPFEGPLRALTEQEASFLEEKIGWYELHRRTIGRVRFEPEAGRYAFPVFGPDKRRRGWVFRSWDDFVRTKALTHMDRDEPHISWYRTQQDGETWIVEDIPSAARIALYRDSLALCGTTCGDDYIAEIAAHTDEVVWALDEDATAKAIKFHRKYGALFESSRVQPLEKDAKDMTEPELRALLQESEG
jgi:hypothetical protein